MSAKLPCLIHKEIVDDFYITVAYLKPSRQLLEFYRKKFAQQDAEHTGLVEKLQTYKKAYEDQVN